jgi:hypothetical protein
MRPHRPLVLSAIAAALAGFAFGPRLYHRLQPVTAEMADLGGKRATLISEGRSYGAVLTPILQHCYSPGIAVFAEADSASGDSLLALATSLGAQVQTRAVHDHDLYVTVNLELRHSRRWPWSDPILLSYGFYHTRAGEWALVGYGAPPGYRPSRTFAPPQKRAA